MNSPLSVSVQGDESSKQALDLSPRNQYDNEISSVSRGDRENTGCEQGLDLSPLSRSPKSSSPIGQNSSNQDTPLSVPTSQDVMMTGMSELGSWVWKSPTIRKLLWFWIGDFSVGGTFRMTLLYGVQSNWTCPNYLWFLWTIFRPLGDSYEFTESS